jgi:hypothetical protein
MRQLLLCVNGVTEQTNLGTLVHNIKCKYEKHLKKAVLRLGGEQELDCT